MDPYTHALVAILVVIVPLATWVALLEMRLRRLENAVRKVGQPPSAGDTIEVCVLGNWRPTTVTRVADGVIKSEDDGCKYYSMIGLEGEAWRRPK